MKPGLIALLNIITYEHEDGPYILIREDIGQEVTNQDVTYVKELSVYSPSAQHNIRSLSHYTYIEANAVPKGVNALVYVERQLDDETSVRSMHYGTLKNMPDNDIRSFVRRKVFG